jgi:tRNA pseudouridine55 synthase
VVDAVARALGMAAVGHAGTLDPLATGVVVVCVGHATKLVDAVHGLTKHYRATFLLGRSSPSDDLETEIVEEPEPLRPSVAALEAALPSFRGAILQRPCDYSAVHVGGKRAYRLARQGTPVEIASKAVRIDRLEITGYDWPRLGLDIVCSSGTFVRAIGRDLAAALGTAAVMESLVRTAVGPFTVERCLPLGQVTPEAAQAALLPAIEAVHEMPRHLLAAEDLDRAVLGGLVSLPADSADALVAVDQVGDLVGILKRHESGRFRLRPNFRGEG